MSWPIEIVPSRGTGVVRVDLCQGRIRVDAEKHRKQVQYRTMPARRPRWRQSLVSSHSVDRVKSSKNLRQPAGPMTFTAARVNIGVHGDFNASGMCKVLEKKTKSMHRLEGHC